MGILLTFMFLWNMLGALVLIPALSYFLLPTIVRCTSPDARRHRRSRTQPDATARKLETAVARPAGHADGPRGS